MNQTCAGCGKTVSAKAILGTLHLCRTVCEVRGFHVWGHVQRGFLWWRKKQARCLDCLEWLA